MTGHQKDNISVLTLLHSGPHFLPENLHFLRWTYISPIFLGFPGRGRFVIMDLVFWHRGPFWHLWIYCATFCFRVTAVFVRGVPQGTRPLCQKVFPHPIVRTPSASITALALSEFCNWCIPMKNWILMLVCFLFIGPRCPWGPIYGSSSLSQTERGLSRLNWCDSGCWRYQLDSNW